MIRTIKKIVAPMQRRVRLMIGRGIITLVNDATKEQSVQVNLLEGEVHDHVERYQEYGFSSVPHTGAEAITVSVGGNRGHSVVIATGDRRYRMKNLGAGEVAIYDDLEQSVHLKRDGITLTSQRVTIDAATTQVNGALAVNGNISSGGNITAAGSVIDTTGNTPHHSHA
jgi:phage baseplate assembly protein V